MLAHHKQAALSSTAACGETKSPFGDARMKEAFYKDFRVCSPSGLYGFFSTDKIISKFFKSIKRKACLSAILSPFLLHTSFFSKKDKGERKDGIP